MLARDIWLADKGSILNKDNFSHRHKEGRQGRLYNSGLTRGRIQLIHLVESAVRLE